MAAHFYASSITPVAGSNTQFTADIFLADAVNVGNFDVGLVLDGDPTGVSYTFTEANVTGFPIFAGPSGISGFSTNLTTGGNFASTGTLIGSVTLTFANAPTTAFKLSATSPILDDLNSNAITVTWDTFASYTPSSGTPVDTTAPTLASASPADNASGVAADSNVVLTFSENIAAGSGNIVISNGAGDTRTLSVSDASQVTFSGNQLTLNPTTDLIAGNSYSVQMASDVIRDAAGNAFAGISDANTLNFSTASAAPAPPPPANGAHFYTSALTPVPGSSTQFTADIFLADAVNVGNFDVGLVLDGDPTGVSYTFTEANVTGFPIFAGPSGISGFSTNLTTGGNFASTGTLIGSVTLTFANAPTTAFKLSATSPILDDLNSNAITVTWDTFASYTPSSGTPVDTTAPTLASASPADNASGVAADSNVVLTFSENIAAGSGNIVISNGAGDTRTLSVSDASQVTFSGNQLTLNPTTDLIAGNSYSVQMASGVIRDAAGNAFAGITDTTTLTFTTQQATTGTLAIQAYSWKAHTLLTEVNVSVAGQSALTGNSGEATINGLSPGTSNLVATRAISGTESSATNAAVNLQDAIAILKMIVGLDVNGVGKPISPYQSLAADYDGNGQVQLSDAIGVLKHVVGLSAPDPVWHFVDETNTSMQDKPILSPGTAPANSVTIGTGSTPQHVGLVGYLSGDVDGSFAGAAGAQDLDVTQPNYFTLLTTSTGLNPNQFGIYP